MQTFKEFSLNESLKGKELSKFKLSVGSKSYEFTINTIKNEFRLNIEGADHYITKLENDNIDDAKKVLSDLIKKVGEAKFISTIEKRKDELEQKKNDTDWEVFSEYNTSRGSMAFKVYHRISSGKSHWKQEPRGKKYLSIHMISKPDEVKKEIENEVKRSKLKHISGWNPETDK